MDNYPVLLSNSLKLLIQQISESPELFVKNPGKDFTRNRKLPLETMLKMLISMGGNSIHKELLDFHEYDTSTSTTSAFIQQRDKILPFAFEFLLHEFTYTMGNPKTYKGHRLLAVDGSDLHIPTDPKDTDNYTVAVDGYKGYNLLHLNALYDLCSKLFMDIIVQPCKGQNEHSALTAMVERSQISSKVIVIADRGYESYNSIAHIEGKGWRYLIRVGEHYGISYGFSLTEDKEFDVKVCRTLTRKQTNLVKSHTETYKYLPANVKFDYLDLNTNKYYPISFRIVRFKISEDAFETVITNLDAIEFPSDELKKIYRMRWGVETSFRELKYAVGLLSFHAKKVEYITQEIFAQLIMYNFSMMVTSHVIIRHNDTKHTYQVNFTEAIHICVFFFRCRDRTPPDAVALIQKCILPIRPDRKALRRIRIKPVVSFLYRVS